MHNPFALAASHTQISFETSAMAADQAELFFGDMALSISAFEVDEAEKRWRVDLVVADAADAPDIARRLAIMAAECKVIAPEFSTMEVTPDLWQSNFEQFPPLNLGRFFVHGSHVTSLPAIGKLPLCVDAGLAFGSGEHATTEGCLALLEAYVKSQPHRHYQMLDMGCGSAILSMAAAKLCPRARILAVEIDRVSATVAAKNVALNRLKPQVSVLAGDGYKSKAVQARAPYDMIMANILARPLMAMARPMSELLADDGVAILSGLLNTQERMVIAAHQMQGMYVKQLWRKSGWTAMMMGKI